ncbi:MAG TPA: cytochrome c maturation protein CcmE [Gaiellaceae bacterium]|nr:cytochrome c maturation protein CcmE [Gaiellaceae bacterium]
MSRRRSPARLVIALSVAALLAVFLLYTSIAGGGTASLQPSELRGHDGRLVQLGGKVVAPVSRDGRTLRFGLRDVKGTERVRVVYTGSVSDQFRVGRDVYLKGRLTDGVFVGEKDSLVTKCPSKYVPKSSGSA